MKKEITENIEIPEGTIVEVTGDTITIKGNGKLISREFIHNNIDLKANKKEVIISSKKATKRENRQIMTIKAHVNNMIKGINENFVYHLQVAYVHFPMNVKIENKELVIKNFLGEKKPRVYKIPSGVEVKIDGNILTVESHDKELAGQVAAGIEKTTKVRKRDKRKFQDGIYITEKPGRKI
jgi:large subunit ribosomal protein L6